MGAHRGLTAALAAMVATAGIGFGSSKHRHARVLRFIYRNRRRHRSIVRALRQRDRLHELMCDQRFAELRAAADKERGDIHPRHQRPASKQQRAKAKKRRAVHA